MAGSILLAALVLAIIGFGIIGLQNSQLGGKGLAWLFIIGGVLWGAYLIL